MHIVANNTQKNAHPAQCGACDFYDIFTILNGTEYGYCPNAQDIRAEQSQICEHYSNVDIELGALGCAGRD